MSPRRPALLRVDAAGRLDLPDDLAARLRLEHGDRLAISFEDSDPTGGLRLSAPLDRLRRVYVEPTSNCNFDCPACVRHAWDEPGGFMHEDTFRRLLDGLAAFRPAPAVFFGGFGEPLSHPALPEMIARVKALGVKTELITNGTLLEEPLARALITAGLDMLWVSLDGATPSGYADVRLGDALPLVIDNLERLRALRAALGSPTPRLGVAFVAMRRNIHELPEVIRLGRRLGAERFSVSNVLAYTPALREEVLYRRSYFEAGGPASPWQPRLQLPRMELNEHTRGPLGAALAGRHSLEVAGQPLDLGGATCPFVRKGSLSVRWDGQVSPCLALLHSHTSYLDQTERRVRAFSFGSLQDASLAEIWHGEEYRALRARLASFDFSPCFTCNSCDLVESNQEDCFGNTAPTCGGCLWAQGFIQCP